MQEVKTMTKKGSSAESFDMQGFESIVDVLEKNCKKYASHKAFSNLGKTITYAELEKLSGDFAAYLQNETDLKPGDRIAVQLPNLIQFPIVVFGAMRAGLIVVNTNPLYTEREMEHQFNDAGVKALVILANMASLAEQVIPDTQIKHVIVTEVGDVLPGIKRFIVNNVVKRIKKMVPAYNLPQAKKFTAVMAKGAKNTFKPVYPTLDDVAILQYTGGTTGVAKGAMLTHRNLVSNMLQMKFVIENVFTDPAGETIVAPLPLYHIYSFTVNCMGMMVTGNHNLLITNPRDIPGFVKELSGAKFSGMLGLNTLFVALCNNEEFRKLDFSGFKLTVSGGMALTKFAAKEWQKVTGSKVIEGYGLTEASPVVSINPPDSIQLGTIGKAMIGTQVKTIDDEGHDLPIGESGELCVKGPQVMKGYWQRPDETAKTFTSDGWLKTGDVAVIQDDNFIRIVDRKKDLIIVSGFNVYPNEVEEVVTSHPEVTESAAIGIPDDKAGETIKVFVVAKDPSLSTERLIAFCRERLTGYKVPKLFEFREDLPKTNVGKILRRSLREEELAKKS